MCDDTTTTDDKLWGGETDKAVGNFPVSGHPIPAPVVHWLGRIKAAAARTNSELGLLDEGHAERIAAAGDAVGSGEHDDQFPVDVFQTGSGTSSNMNANEVIATLSGAHPNDHVNMGQSSNDVFPSAVHLAALDGATNTLLPALSQLEASFAAKAEAFKDIVKSGRTHLMDAVPVTLGQEFAGYTAQELDISLTRGELDGRANNASSVLRRNPEWFDKGIMNFHAIMEVPKGEKHPKLGHLPEIGSFARNDRENKLIAIWRAFRSVGSPYVLPPGTPKDRVAILEEAMTKTLKDPEFSPYFK